MDIDTVDTDQQISFAAGALELIAVKVEPSKASDADLARRRPSFIARK